VTRASSGTVLCTVLVGALLLGVLLQSKPLFSSPCLNIWMEPC
jgi:hypothetical protein